MARQQFVQQDPEAEDIGPMIDLRAARLLGRHVGRRAERHPRLGHVPGACHGPVAAECVHKFRQTEVDDLRVSLFGQHHVGRLQVAVHDADLVRARETFGDLDGDVKGSGRRQRTARDDVAERLAPHQLHGDERHPFDFADVVDDSDMRMLERGGGACLLHESRAS